jgi:GDP-L-fucose synthase
MNDNIMECAKEQRVKVVSCMSSDVFPMQSSTKPLNESMVHSGAPHHLHEGYAYAKRMQELMNRAYRKQYNTHFTAVIPADTYGPDDNFKVDHEHIIASLIHKCHLSKQSGEPLKIQTGVTGNSATVRAP